MSAIHLARAVMMSLLVCVGSAAAQDAAVPQNAAAGQDAAVPQDPALQDPAALQEPAVPQRPPVVTPLSVPPLKRTGTVQRLDFTIGLYEGYDLTLATASLPELPVDPRFRLDTSFSSASGSLAFTRATRNVDFALNGGANLRYFTVVPGELPVDYYGGFAISSRRSRHIRLRASESASFSPYYSFGDFAGPQSAGALVAVNINQVALNTNQNVARLKTLTSNSSAGLSWAPTLKTTFDTGYILDVVDTSNAAYQTLTQGANAAMQHRTTRYSSLRLGYGYRRSQLGGTQDILQVHNIDSGFGYQRPLSFSRHTTVGFNVGSSLLAQAQVYAFFITGNAALAQQLTRRWTTSLSYNREISTFAGSTQAFLSDTVSGSLNGAITRKVGATLSGGYSRGRVAIGVDNGYASIYASGRLQYRLGRYVPIYGEYVYYNYRFDQQVGLASSFPLVMNRHGLRVGLTYSVPLIGRRVG